jgi:hypothetical protein
MSSTSFTSSITEKLSQFVKLLNTDNSSKGKKYTLFIYFAILLLFNPLTTGIGFLSRI